MAVLLANASGWGGGVSNFILIQSNEEVTPFGRNIWPKKGQISVAEAKSDL